MPLDSLPGAVASFLMFLIQLASSFTRKQQTGLVLPQIQSPFFSDASVRNLTTCHPSVRRSALVPHMCLHQLGSRASTSIIGRGWGDGSSLWVKTKLLMPVLMAYAKVSSFSRMAQSSSCLGFQWRCRHSCRLPIAILMLVRKWRVSESCIMEDT